MHKFVISVLKLEEVTQNLILSKSLPLDQLNPVHLSWSRLFILLSVFNLGKINETNIPQTSFSGNAESY